MGTTDLIIINEYGDIFCKSLTTLDYIFFTDESDGIMMFYLNDLQRKPLQAYGAEEILIQTILNNKWTWASDDMKYNIQCILEEPNYS